MSGRFYPSSWIVERLYEGKTLRPSDLKGIFVPDSEEQKYCDIVRQAQRSGKKGEYGNSSYVHYLDEGKRDLAFKIYDDEVIRQVNDLGTQVGKILFRHPGPGSELHMAPLYNEVFHASKTSNFCDMISKTYGVLDCDRPALMMENVKGMVLEEALTSMKFKDLEEVRALMLQISAVITLIHMKGFRHLDFHPGNIILQDISTNEKFKGKDLAKVTHCEIRVYNDTWLFPHNGFLVKVIDFEMSKFKDDNLHISNMYELKVEDDKLVERDLYIFQSLTRNYTGNVIQGRYQTTREWDEEEMRKGNPPSEPPSLKDMFAHIDEDKTELEAFIAEATTFSRPLIYHSYFDKYRQ